MAARRAALPEAGMEIINPLANALLQGTQVQRQMATDKQRQVRRAQTLSRDAAAHCDELEHQVESTEEVTPVRDEDEHDQRLKKDPRSQSHESAEVDAPDEPPHLDVTA